METKQWKTRNLWSLFHPDSQNAPGGGGWLCALAVCSPQWILGAGMEVLECHALIAVAGLDGPGPFQPAGFSN